MWPHCYNCRRGLFQELSQLVMVVGCSLAVKPGIVWAKEVNQGVMILVAAFCVEKVERCY
jgi:hypothetical protein